MVTLQWTEMTPSQQAAVQDILGGAALQQEKEAESMGHPGVVNP